MPDNDSLCVNGDDVERLAKVLDLCEVQGVTGILCGDNCLVLKHTLSQPPHLSFKPSLLANTIFDWLHRKKVTAGGTYHAPDYGPEPDIDGSSSKGWRVVGTMDKIEIHPCWMMYHN